MRTGKQNIIDPDETLGECLGNFPCFRAVFENLGIDLEIHAGDSLRSVCVENRLDPDTTLRILLACDGGLATPQTHPVELLPLDDLCDHLESLHTRFHAALDRLEQAAQAGDPVEPGGSTLFEIQERLAEFREGMAKHLREETEVFFPLIRQLNNSRAAKTGAFDLLKVPLAEMRSQHSEMDEALAELEMLIDDYGQTFAHPKRQALRDRLNDLQKTLQVQIYQENQILFRRVLSSLG